MIDVERPAEAPGSLALGRKYNGTDVLEALHTVFKGKCYLCESPIQVGTFAVDHRRPQGDPRFSHLVHAWENLFPSCNEYRCNERREKKYPDGDLLDPGQGVERRVAQRLEGLLSLTLRNTCSVDFVFSASDPSDTPARNTAEELDRIHNATGSTAIAAASALRMKIHEHVAAVTQRVFLYLALVMSPSPDPVALAKHERLVRRLVSRAAPYAMLVRSYFTHIPAVRALFD